MNRRALLAIVAAVAVAFAGVGWLAGRRIKSPAEVAAEQASPAPSLITVAVEMRELSQRLVVRGTALSNESAPITVSSATGETIITRLTKESGAQLDEGDVAIEVAGRPVFVVQGELPVFRSLIPTLEGPDVRQLEEALVRLGYDPGPADGLYDAATADAVASMYRDAGYAPVEPSDDDLATLKAERAAVDEAEATLDEAQKILSDARAGPSESARIQLDQAVAEAKAALAAAESGDDVTAATAARKEAEQAATAAKAAADEASSRLASARNGTHPDTGQPPTAEELSELEAADEAARAGKTEADQVLSDAKAAETAAINGQAAAIESAKRGVALAEATRREGLSSDTADAAKGVTRASERLRDARATLNETQAKIDVRFPAAELVFLSSLPRKIQTLTVEPGDQPTGPVMTVTGSGTTITSGVAAADRRLIEVGDEAILEDEDLGINAPGKISFIADSPGGSDDVASDRYLIRIEPNEELPEDALNVNFKITIPVTASEGEVMAVPLAALSAGADGTSRVEVERVDGSTELVRVNPGLKAEGFVEIEVIQGDLEAGDRVVVGRDLVLPGEAEGDEDPEGDQGGEALPPDRP